MCIYIMLTGGKGFKVEVLERLTPLPTDLFHCWIFGFDPVMVQ